MLLISASLWTKNFEMQRYQPEQVARWKDKLFLWVQCQWMTYFVVSCDKLCDCMESPHPCKLARSCNSLEVQLLLLLLFFCQSTLLFGRFFFLHGFPDITRDCPVIYWYVRLFTFFLVNVIMLTNMCTTRWVPSLVEGFVRPMHFDKCLVNPDQVSMRPHLGIITGFKTRTGYG